MPESPTVEFVDMTREELIFKLLEQKKTIETMKSCAVSEPGATAGGVVNDIDCQMERYKRQRDVLSFKLKCKDRQIEQLSRQLEEMKGALLSQNEHVLDPAIDGVFKQMKSEVETCRKAKQTALDELQGASFTAESRIGKLLMNRCTKLLEENEELGRMVASGTIAKLETDVSLHKHVINELKAKPMLDGAEKSEGLENVSNVNQQQLTTVKEEPNVVDVDTLVLSEPIAEEDIINLCEPVMEEYDDDFSSLRRSPRRSEKKRNLKSPLLDKTTLALQHHAQRANRDDRPPPPTPRISPMKSAKKQSKLSPIRPRTTTSSHQSSSDSRKTRRPPSTEDRKRRRHQSPSSSFHHHHRRRR